MSVWRSYLPIDPLVSLGCVQANEGETFVPAPVRCRTRPCLQLLLRIPSEATAGNLSEQLGRPADVCGTQGLGEEWSPGCCLEGVQAQIDAHRRSPEFCFELLLKDFIF